MFNQLLNLWEGYYVYLHLCLLSLSKLHKLYYHVLILIELYFNNFDYFSNFRPLTCFSVMIPETV